MSYQINFFLIIYLVIGSIFAQEMKRDMQLQNWNYQKREESCLFYCGFTKDENFYPCFLDKKDAHAQRSLRDDLLYAKRILEPGLLKEIATYILRYSYLIEQYCDRILIEKYTKTFYKSNSSDLLYLNQINKQTLLYILQDGLQKNNEIRVEGRDKEFARKMAHNILNLPVPIQENIITLCGPEIKCNLNYKPLWRNILLDQEENKEHCASVAATVGGTGCHYTLCGCIWYGSKDIWGWVALKKSITVASIFLNYLSCSLMSDKGINSCFDWSLPLTCGLCCACGTGQTVKYMLEKICADRDTRHGFEDIRLLEDMPCEIRNL